MKQRQTRQKKVVLDALCSLCHPTATEVYRYTHDEYPSVSRATVFRVLKQAEGNGTVRRLVCGRVDDLDVPSAVDLEKGLTDARGYAVESHEVVFRGVCPVCRAAQNAPAEK